MLHVRSLQHDKGFLSISDSALPAFMTGAWHAEVAGTSEELLLSWPCIILSSGSCRLALGVVLSLKATFANRFSFVRGE